MNTQSANSEATEVAEAVAEFEGEMREFVRKGITFLQAPKPEAMGDVSHVNSVIQRVAGWSMEEIEDLIVQLQELREALQVEAERVQREIAGYAKLSQAAREHVVSISDQLAEWKTELASRRIERV